MIFTASRTDGASVARGNLDVGGGVDVVLDLDLLLTKETLL
ncbi:MAG: hypothetical protein CM15mV4_1360 [Caudoviricetes sp.]|nr:MAG: hypothetical protein CM15mV4_1360 [Caudoviricetes sp.]